MTHLDLFSGMGGFSLGLKKVFNIEKTYYSEIDKYAKQVYNYNFKNSDRNSDYEKQHLAILKNKSTDKLCTFKEGKQLVYLINQIRSRSKK